MPVVEVGLLVFEEKSKGKIGGFEGASIRTVDDMEGSFPWLDAVGWEQPPTLTRFWAAR
jgi:hypothetical protein